MQQRSLVISYKQTDREKVRKGLVVRSSCC